LAEDIFLSMMASLIMGISFFLYAVSPVNDSNVTQTIDIPKGFTFSQTTNTLYEADLVKNRPFFWLLAIGKGVILHVRAGRYELSGAMSPALILDKLSRGDIRMYLVTLPEGLTYREIAQILAVCKLINETEFMPLTTDKAFLASLDIKGNSIEGYLYPGAYKFDQAMTSKDIMRVMVQQFWKEITPEMRKKAQEMGMTFNEWVTLASIICKYSGTKEEKAIISAVLHNRLKQGMKLQSDPTAIYSLEQREKPVQKGRKYYRESDTPYNTYRIRGLPPGPIANPDIDSLRAALYPAKVDYLYIMAKRGGKYTFSKNIHTHNDGSN